MGFRQSPDVGQTSMPGGDALRPLPLSRFRPLVAASVAGTLPPVPPEGLSVARHETVADANGAVCYYWGRLKTFHRSSLWRKDRLYPALGRACNREWREIEALHAAEDERKLALILDWWETAKGDRIRAESEGGDVR